jgi:dTDP-4-dehydrorhamnose reductase
LATHKLQQAFDLAMPPWQDGVTRMLSETHR